MVWNLQPATNVKVQGVPVPNAPVPGQPQIPTGMPIIALCMTSQEERYAEFEEKTWIPLTTIPHPAFAKRVFSCRHYSMVVARNVLARTALATDCTHLLWVDSDIIPENPADVNICVEALLKAMEQGKSSVVTACYRAKQATGFPYALWAGAIEQGTGKKGYIPLETWQGNWINIDNCALGFVLMKRQVFDRLLFPYFSWTTDTEPSEDFRFFENVKAAGFQLNAYTDVKMSHIGKFKVRTDGTFRTLDI